MNLEKELIFIFIFCWSLFSITLSFYYLIIVESLLAFILVQFIGLITAKNMREVLL